MTSSSRFSLKWFRILFWGIASAEGAGCLVALLSIPGDPKHGLLFGFSAQRLALLGVAALFLLVCLILTRLAVKESPWLVVGLEKPVLDGSGFLPAFILVSLLFVAGWVLLFLPASQWDARLLPYTTRFYPLLVWLTAFCGQSVIFLLAGHFGFDPHRGGDWKTFRVSFFFCLAVFSGVGAIAAVTGLGIRPDRMGWYEPGAPLLAGQIASALLVAVFLSLAEGKLSISQKQSIWLDMIVAVLIWAAAFGIWMHQPLQVSYFSPEPRAPNNEIYPYSDAAYYTSIAQSVIIGDGYLKGQSVPRPLYILFLALVQTLQGPGYGGMIRAQTLVLALFPVVLYFIGRELKNRTLGVLLASLEIMREVNAIWATADIQVSNSKLLLSELPTALGISLLILLLLLALKNKRWSSPWIFAAGGVLGCIMLIRTQAIILSAAVAFCLFCGMSGSLTKRLRPVILFALGFLLCISPWLARNYGTYHKIVFDKPDSGDYWQITYSAPFGDDPALGTSDQPGPFDPGLTAYFTAAHFIHNEISTLMILPAGMEFKSLEETLAAPSFWLDWDGRLTAEQVLVMAVNLLLIGLGISAAWRRARFAGLLPLLLHLTYSLGDAFTRYSGGRFILPVDWIVLIYFGLGALTVIDWGLGSLGLLPADQPNLPVARGMELGGSRRVLGVLAGLILLVGSLPWLAETVIPQRYPTLTRERTLALLQKTDAPEDKLTHLENLLDRGGGIAIEGRLLYPRYYRTEAGEPGQNWYAYSTLPFRRMGLIVVGNRGITQVVLPVENPPEPFPNGSDAIILGCELDVGVNAAAILLPQENRILFSDADFTNGCPAR